MSDHHELGPLLNRVLADDEEALDALLAKVRPYLHLLVRQQLEQDLRHKLDDSDIVQETLMKINGGLKPATQGMDGHFKGQTPPEFLVWISQIVRHVIVDLERRGKAQRRDERREVPGSKVFATLIQGSTPEQGVERAERAVKLAAALERLPQHKRDVLVSRFFEQLSFEEISRRTGRGVKALRVLCCRALKDLREDGQLLGLMVASS